MKKTADNGFTLIELIIGITLMTLFLGMSIVAYSQAQKEKNIERDAQLVIDKLRLARERTIGRNIGTNTACDFLGYKVDLKAPAVGVHTGDIILMCQGLPDSTINSFQLTASKFTQAKIITFTPSLGCETDICSPRVNNSIRLQNTQNMCFIDISIDLYGNTSVTKPSCP